MLYVHLNADACIYCGLSLSNCRIGNAPKPKTINFHPHFSNFHLSIEWGWMYINKLSNTCRYIQPKETMSNSENEIKYIMVQIFTCSIIICVYEFRWMQWRLYLKEYMGCRINTTKICNKLCPSFRYIFCISREKAQYFVSIVSNKGQHFIDFDRKCWYDP